MQLVASHLTPAAVPSHVPTQPQDLSTAEPSQWSKMQFAAEMSVPLPPAPPELENPVKPPPDVLLAVGAPPAPEEPDANEPEELAPDEDPLELVVVAPLDVPPRLVPPSALPPLSDEHPTVTATIEPNANRASRRVRIIQGMWRRSRTSSRNGASPRIWASIHP